MISHKRLFSLFILLLSLLCTGCSSNPLKGISPEAPDPAAESYRIGKHVSVTNPCDPFIVQDIKDALSYDGMYYASWVVGNSIPFTNSDGDSVELYDAQLYMIFTESESSEEAEKNAQNWLSSARENYLISEESAYTANNIDYQIITYTYMNENPYIKGISAFASHEGLSLCIEFSARESFQDNLDVLLKQFLSHCYYQ